MAVVKNKGQTDIIQPGEIIPISWDFANELSAGEEVIGRTVTAVNEAGTDVTSTIIQSSGIIDGTSTNSKVYFIVQDLTGDQTYKVTIMASVNATKVLEADIEIPSRER